MSLLIYLSHLIQDLERQLGSPRTSQESSLLLLLLALGLFTIHTRLRLSACFLACHHYPPPAPDNLQSMPFGCQVPSCDYNLSPSNVSYPAPTIIYSTCNSAPISTCAPASITSSPPLTHLSPAPLPQLLPPCPQFTTLPSSIPPIAR